MKSPVPESKKISEKRHVVPPADVGHEHGPLPTGPDEQHVEIFRIGVRQVFQPDRYVVDLPVKPDTSRAAGYGVAVPMIGMAIGLAAVRTDVGPVAVPSAVR
jgi:hypothetical protein